KDRIRIQYSLQPRSQNKMTPRIARRKLLHFGAALSLAFTGTTAFAQAAEDYPSAPITMIVGWTAGGPADGVARLVAAEMSKELGQSIVVENKGGAGGNIGSVAAARAKPDGYTIMLSTVASHGLNAALYDNIGYDPIKDFAPIGLISLSPSTML